MFWSKIDIDGLVQERHNPVANALGLRLSCTDLSISSCQNEMTRVVKKRRHRKQEPTFVAYSVATDDLVKQGARVPEAMIFMFTSLSIPKNLSIIIPEILSLSVSLAPKVWWLASNDLTKPDISIYISSFCCIYHITGITEKSQS